jgi:hypothetical protein
MGGQLLSQHGLSLKRTLPTSVAFEGEVLE